MDQTTQEAAAPAVVEVNEVIVFTCSTKEVALTWALYRGRMPEERIRVITASMAGDLVQVVCDDDEHAGWLAQQILDWGVPSRAVRVIRGAVQA